MEKIRRLQGMEDLAGPTWHALREVQQGLGSFFARYGYAPLDTPLLEDADLFLRKVGGELAVRMYTFADPGGNRVVLRPEFTASVVRRYLEVEGSQPLPWRVQYCGPVFRYESDTDRRQFTQAGVEIIGTDSAQADAEVLDLAFASLNALGVTGHVLTVGDAGIYHSLVEQLGLSERARRFLLGSLALLAEGEAGLAKVEEEAQRLHLIRTETDDETPSGLGTSFDEEASRALLRHLLVDAPELLGQRTPQEVEERLLSRLRGDRPKQVRKALEVAFRLASIRGEPSEALGSARGLTREYKLSAEPLDRLANLLELVSQQEMPKGSLALDMGLVRGVAYYTGFVFDVTHPSAPLVLGGGGRYDTLVRELGHTRDVPALGFALTLENVAGLVGGPPPAQAEQAKVLAVPENKAAYNAALRVAQALRREGKVVEMELVERSTDERMAYARARGIQQVVVVDAEGRTVERSVEEE